jgi:hypothetical protein
VTWTFKRAADARAGLENLIIVMYERLFAWLVHTINGTIASHAGSAYEAALDAAPPGQNEPLFVAVVDAFGIDGALPPDVPAVPTSATEWFRGGSEPGGLDLICTNYAAEKVGLLSNVG